ncbi:MAG: ATP-binding cassette domain-containing protein, partial [Deinococcus sp.]|nr:ATP-binding cassette domain-containing protein [Deinococcus sp.]
MTTPRVQSEYRIEPDRAPVLIALQGVCKIYGQGPQEVHALKQVSLAVPAGEFVVILGPSGSGKTTLLNLLGGLDTPSMGTATVDGVELAALSPPALTQYRREHVGFIFQFYNLIPTLTAQENVELAARL